MHKPGTRHLNCRDGGRSDFDAHDLVTVRTLRGHERLGRFEQTQRRATLTDNGAIQLPDGREVSSSSRAAVEAPRVASYDGRYGWVVVRINKTLNDLRKDLVGQFGPD